MARGAQRLSPGSRNFGAWAVERSVLEFRSLQSEGGEEVWKIVEGQKTT